MAYWLGQWPGSWYRSSRTSRPHQICASPRCYPPTVQWPAVDPDGWYLDTSLNLLSVTRLIILSSLDYTSLILPVLDDISLTLRRELHIEKDQARPDFIFIISVRHDTLVHYQLFLLFPKRWQSLDTRGTMVMINLSVWGRLRPTSQVHLPMAKLKIDASAPVPLTWKTKEISCT